MTTVSCTDQPTRGETTGVTARERESAGCMKTDCAVTLNFAGPVWNQRRPRCRPLRKPCSSLANMTLPSSARRNCYAALRDSFDQKPWSTFADVDRIAPHTPWRRLPTLVLNDGEGLIDSATIRVIGALDALERGRSL